MKVVNIAASPNQNNIIMKTIPLIALALLLPIGAQAEINRTRSVTGPNGNTTTRNVTGSYTPGSGYTRDATTTGPNGQSASSSRTVTAAPYGRNVQSTVTGPNGKTASSNVYKGRYGHATGGSVTGPQGNTRRFFRFHR